jgi:hypothetical protein
VKTAVQNAKIPLYAFYEEHGHMAPGLYGARF